MKRCEICGNDNETEAKLCQLCGEAIVRLIQAYEDLSVCKRNLLKLKHSYALYQISLCFDCPAKAAESEPEPEERYTEEYYDDGP